MRGQVGLLLEMHRTVTQGPPGDVSSGETETPASLVQLLLLKGDMSPTQALPRIVASLTREGKALR